SKCTTWPSAWTPASVLPAATALDLSPEKLASAASRTPWTVRSAFSWICQPRKSVPMYERSARYRVMESARRGGEEERRSGGDPGEVEPRRARTRRPGRIPPGFPEAGRGARRTRESRSSGRGRPHSAASRRREGPTAGTRDRESATAEAARRGL